jgi:transcriptional regulator with XRE-family HTH domain
MITPLQLRLGRTALGLGVRDLAAVSGVGAATITRIENGRPGNRSTLFVLEHALAQRGIVFVAADRTAGPGVRVARDFGDGRGDFP